MFGDDPTLCIYDTEMMRRHLYKSLMSGKCTPFPQKLRASKGQQLKTNDDFEIHCYCRMPELENIGMIDCTNCSQWFHLDCDSVPAEALNNPPMTWFRCFYKY